MLKKLDPIESGSKIFFNIFKEFGEESIIELDVLDKFLNRLITETNGWFIIDFLDSGNWDCLGSYEIDYKNKFVFLNWHYNEGTTKIESFIKKTKYKPNIISIMLHFKDLQMETIGKDLPFVTIRGYAVKEKQALKYLKTIDKNAKQIKEEKENFYTLYNLDRGNYNEDCYCHDTPIYSILMIPKDTAGSADLSRKILFLYNYINCGNRIAKASLSLSKNTIDEDEICEKANSIRRIFEFVLKIECCYHSGMKYYYLNRNIKTSFEFQSSYSDMKLGDLITILKPIKNKKEIIELNRIVRLSNELSHDSGKPVTKPKAMDLIETTSTYIADLIKLIKL